MIVYSKDDRFSLDMGEVQFVLSPLSQKQKMEILSLGRISNGEESKSLDMAMKTIQYCLKEVHGIQRGDGSEYVLEMENGLATEDAIDTIMNCQLSEKLISSCMQFLSGVPDKIINPVSGEELDGVQFKYLGGSPDKKK